MLNEAQLRRRASRAQHGQDGAVDRYLSCGPRQHGFRLLVKPGSRQALPEPAARAGTHSRRRGGTRPRHYQRGVTRGPPGALAAPLWPARTQHTGELALQQFAGLASLTCLQDQRLIFRLYKQQFVELLRSQQAPIQGQVLADAIGKDGKLCKVQSARCRDTRREGPQCVPLVSNCFAGAVCSVRAVAPVRLRAGRVPRSLHRVQARDAASR